MGTFAMSRGWEDGDGRPRLPRLDIMGRGVYDLVESELVLVKGDRLHSYDAVHAHYTRLVLKYRAYMVYRTRYEYRTEYY